MLVGTLVVTALVDYRVGWALLSLAPPLTFTCPAQPSLAIFTAMRCPMLYRKTLDPRHWLHTKLRHDLAYTHFRELPERGLRPARAGPAVDPFAMMRGAKNLPTSYC